MLIAAINTTLNELITLLKQISTLEYCKPCASLSNATIGEHIRHIIEMFQCLQNNYESGIVNYDNRQRNVLTQTETELAINSIEIIQNSLKKKNKKIELQKMIEEEEILIESNYFRELLYNLEHCVHHQALIKVAVLQSGTISVDENFGVARSTIEYRKQCVQ
jgi:hypothetical protein